MLVKTMGQKKATLIFPTKVIKYIKKTRKTFLDFRWSSRTIISFIHSLWGLEAW